MYNLYSQFKLLIIVIVIAICLCISAYIYRVYIITKKIDAFTVKLPHINEINNLDTTSNANNILTNNNYVGVMSNAYNKLVLEDEATIKNLYVDSIDRANILIALKSVNNNNLKNKSSIYPAGSLIKTIKSKNNSQMLSLNSSDPSGKYSVNVNDKCLTVSGTCTDNNVYCTQDCNNSIYSSDAQKFTVFNIATISDAHKVMGPRVNISSANIYPFNIVRSVVDNTCLSMSNSGVTLEPCNLNDIRHQWSISPDENICLAT